MPLLQPDKMDLIKIAVLAVVFGAAVLTVGLMVVLTRRGVRFSPRQSWLFLAPLLPFFAIAAWCLLMPRSGVDWWLVCTIVIVVWGSTQANEAARRIAELLKRFRETNKRESDRAR